jgi:isochorismate synthase
MYSQIGLEDNRKSERRASTIMVRPFTAAQEGAFESATASVDSRDLLCSAQHLGLGGDDPSTLLTAFGEVPARGEGWASFGVLAEESASDRPGALALVGAISRAGLVTLRSGPPPPGPFVGGMAFDLDRPPTGAWRGFPASRWVLPRFILWRRGEACFVTALGRRGEDDVGALLRRGVAMAEGVPRAPVAAEPEVETASPDGARGRRGQDRLQVAEDRPAWDLAMARALEAIAARRVQKVVMARTLAASPVSAPLVTVLARLRAGSPASYTFFFRGEGGEAFVGATPETLCRLDGRDLVTEALAGTAPPDAAAQLRRDKESREHRSVVDAIRAGLAPLCEWLEISGRPELIELPMLVHRRTPIVGTLRRGVSLAEVVGALHPTPAVGGAPREAAMALIREVEGLDRGWYAGVVGTVGAGAAELRVALRSALLDGASARLFVGAGVVAGSTAEGEWEETRTKSRTVLRALGEQEG